MKLYRFPKVNITGQANIVGVLDGALMVLPREDLFSKFF